MRRILITNDDGIKADGLIRLAQAAAAFGEVWVVAPDSQRSSLSHSVTLRDDFTVWEEVFPVNGVRAFACSGTPADCVRIGVLHILPEKPNAVFSGINYGYNVATDIQYSATAGAAFEASFQGIPAMAFSEGADPCHEVCDHYLREIITELIDTPLPPNKIWNVNFPSCKLSECRGVLRDRTVSSDVFYKDTYSMRPDGSGRFVCHVVGTRKYTAAEGTDMRAVFDNYVSIGQVTNIS